MDTATLEYLKQRFEEYYSENDPVLPPKYNSRELGFIPWVDGKTQMVRHQSPMQFDSVSGMLEQKRPRHVYMSAALYDAPGASSMEMKNWQGADLVFDIDGDHLPNIDPDTASVHEILSYGKKEVLKLIDFLRTDFGFDDLQVVFSGGRGYHVHVRDEGVQQLGKDARRDIVDYITAYDMDIEMVTEERRVSGSSGRSDTSARHLIARGWGNRVRDQIVKEAEAFAELSREDAVDKLMNLLDGVGEGRAENIYGVCVNQQKLLEKGRLDQNPAFGRFAKWAAKETFRSRMAHIDEPVTTDVHRLIRLPGTIHGGSALQVVEIEEDEIEEFRPFQDAVPDVFCGGEIRIDVQESSEVRMLGEEYSFSSGEQTVPEAAGMHLIASGRALKITE